MDIMHLTGSDIRRLRDGLGWTREKLCEAAGVAMGTIHDIEMGISKNPGLETLKKLLLAMPNYVPVDVARAQLILDIQSALASLDKDKLLAVKSFTDGLTSDLI